MAAKNSAFDDVVVSWMAASPTPASSRLSREEILASSAATGGFYFHGHDAQAPHRGFYFQGHDGQASAQPCRAATVGGAARYCFASISMPLQETSACETVHRGGVAVDAAARNAREVKMMHGHAFVAAVATMPRSVQSIVKGRWTTHEDTLLLKLVEQYGTPNWSKIAKHIAGRDGNQCRHRWNNHLRPNIKKGTWTEEEERIFVEAHSKFGNKWSMIAKCIPGRSASMVSDHWNLIKRSLKAKYRTKKTEPHPTILADYIRNKKIFIETGGRPAPTPRIPTLLDPLGLTLGRPGNPPTATSSSDMPASSHLGDYIRSTMTFIEADNSPAAASNTPKLPDPLELTLGRSANLPIAPSSSDMPASSQLGDYHNIMPPTMHLHVDLSTYYVPQDGLGSNTYSYPLHFPGYPDNNYLQPFSTLDVGDGYYCQYCSYPKYYHAYDTCLDKAFAHINLN